MNQQIASIWHPNGVAVHPTLSCWPHRQERPTRPYGTHSVPGEVL